MKGKAGKSECVKVAIRVRPMNKHEMEQNSKLCVEVDKVNNTVSVFNNKGNAKTFQFDYVFPMDASQREIYDTVAFPIVDSIFQGYNGTVFAYGQTGCGKTFTMMGIIDNPDLKGIIPNAFSHIFGFIKTEGESKTFLVRCSFVEIYNEEVRDLLVSKSKKLDIREDPKKGIFVKELTYVTLQDTQDIQKCLDNGNKNRHVGHTSMNDQSSRSHSIFTVYLETEENGKIRSGKLNLVDLAGSERVGKTNATGQTFDEGKKINLSLTALGGVIDALSSNRKHIPYKDSKLTRLLADSLGGNTKTVMFANISPASYNYEETFGTLRYASRAKLIKNAPKVNEDPKDALLRKYEEEIKALKEQLSNGGNVAVGEPKKKRKKKKKVKKVEENEEDGENGENNEENEENGDEDGEGDNYNDFALVEDDPEKIKLKEKLAALEKNLLDNKKLDVAGKCNNEDQAEMDEKIKEQEEENRKFREYREQQLKQSEEMEMKLKKLEEEKIKEEESLKNDANKLQKRIKELTSEIEEIKLDNGKDRTDYMEGVKAIYRDNQFYREILRYMLSKSELDQIIEMSKYNEEEDKWNVQSFSFQEKSLSLPSMKLGQFGGRFGRPNNNGNKQIIFQNYGDEDNNNNNNNSNEDNDDDDNYEENIHKDFEDLNRKREYEMKKTQSRSKYKLMPDKGSSDSLINLNDFDDKANSRINFRLSKEKLYVDGKRQAKSQAPGERNLGTKKNFSNTANALEMNNINKILMRKKEREKFEQLSNGMNKGYLNPMHESPNKHRKIILNPLGSDNGNNIEVSFKATVEINNKMPPIGNKKINMRQIHEDEYD